MQIITVEEMIKRLSTENPQATVHVGVLIVGTEPISSIADFGVEEELISSNLKSVTINVGNY